MDRRKLKKLCLNIVLDKFSWLAGYTQGVWLSIQEPVTQIFFKFSFHKYIICCLKAEAIYFVFEFS